MLLSLIFACKDAKVKKINQEVYDKYITVGHDIAVEAQKTLLMNVSQAMQKGGPEYAVEFCHLEALPRIEKLYPDDKAMGYHEGELRGLWKITFSD